MAQKLYFVDIFKSKHSYFQVCKPFLAQVRCFLYVGASPIIGFLLLSRKVSQLGYMLLLKLYINLAIAVIFMLFSSPVDQSMKICPIRRAPRAVWEIKICFVPNLEK